jgi:hypothetical protein
MKTLRRAALPLTVLISVLCLHFLWYTRCGPHVGWVSLGPTASPSPLRRYLESQSLWLGASYALSLAFAGAALRRYREERFCQACYLTIGGYLGVWDIGGGRLLHPWLLRLTDACGVSQPLWDNIPAPSRASGIPVDWPLSCRHVVVDESCEVASCQHGSHRYLPSRKRVFLFYRLT